MYLRSREGARSKSLAFSLKVQAWPGQKVVPFEVLKGLSLAKGSILHSILLSCLGKRFSIHYPPFREESRLPQVDPLLRVPIYVGLRSHRFCRKGAG
jgi:hypothetical protein